MSGRPDREPFASAHQIADHATEIRRATQLAANMEKSKARAVAKAREAGVSWSVIAVGLGVSKQAAQQKYGRGPAV